MKKTSETVVFFGSGPVAAVSLELLARNFIIEAVITKPRPVHHRGDVPVIRIAHELHIPVLTADSRKSLDELFASRPVQSNLAVLIDFGIIVSQNVIDYFPLGIINSHFSLLPEWRGADPITFAILSGQQETGVSLMLLVAAMDEGPLLAQIATPIMDTETAASLTKKLITASNTLLVDTLPLYRAGTILPKPQPPAKATYSHKLSKADGVVDWQKPATQLEREIRAYIEWPKTRAILGGLDIIITAAHVVKGDRNNSAGTVVIRDRQLIVHCGVDSLVLDRLKPSGKQEMTGEAFLAGYKTSLLLA